MKHKNVLRLSEAFDEWDAKDLQAEYDRLPKGDEDDAPFEDDDDDESGLSGYFSEPKHKDTDDYSADLDDLEGPSSIEDIEDFSEPTYHQEEPAAEGKEAMLRELQAELRSLPMGDPRKKGLAMEILKLHKELNAEDEDYAKRSLDKTANSRRAEASRQSWIDNMMADEDPFESSMVLRCSEFILLEKKRAEVMKDANAKYPNLSKAEMKKMLKDQEAGAKDFKTKAKKYFGWAKDPEAAAAAFIRKATGKEPKDV